MLVHNANLPGPRDLRNGCHIGAEGLPFSALIQRVIF
jgi:hypothetical protein